MPAPPQTFVNYCSNGAEDVTQGVRRTSDEPNCDFYVSPSKDNKAIAYAGVKDVDSVPVYAHVLQYDDTKEIDIQYFFFYAYNGTVLLSNTVCPRYTT